MLVVMNLPSTSSNSVSEPSTTSEMSSVVTTTPTINDNVTTTVHPSTTSPTEIIQVPTSPPPSVVMAQAPSTTVANPVDYAGSHDSPDTKEGIEELCPVCGDRVSGYHYGLLTCESCKGFFKRTVQNKKVYTCVADRNCHIDKSQRKRCPFCRFQKCLDVGMKLEAVRADRMRGGRNKFGPMYKRDRARKLQAIRQQQLSVRGGPTCQIGPGQNDMYAYQPQSTTPIVTSTAPGARIYDPSVPHIKQELIQIPQLSSSTSSPDSSPSPLTTLGNHHHPNNQQPITVVASGESKQASWPPPQTPTSPHDPKSYHYDSMPVPPHGGQTGDDRIPAVIRQFQQTTMDDKEWQNQLFGLLQNQTYNQCEVDLFELMCKVIDQGLFAQVDWARNSIFFKDLKVDDQMKLLQHSWSDILILDHIHQRLHSNLPDETTLPNGQKFDLLSLALLGQPSMSEQLNKLAMQLQDLKFDEIDFICLKFLLLLNQDSLTTNDVRGLTNRKLVQEAQERVQRALHEYCINCHPQISDKFGRMMALMPDLHYLSSHGEEYLYYKHLNGKAPTQTLLMEMLHAKRK